MLSHRFGRSSGIVFIALVFVFSVVFQQETTPYVFVSARPTFDTSTREEILANRENRKKQLEKMILDVRQKLADHSAGQRLLNEEDKDQLEKKLDIYQRKLDTMQGPMDEREVERILKREELRYERQEERRSSDFRRGRRSEGL